MLSKGKRFRIFVTSVSRIDSRYPRIWAQSDFEGNEKVEELMLNVQSDASIAESQVDINSLRVGDVVIAKYVTDGCWYRAEIRHVDKSVKKCKVQFIDYGNEETVLSSDILRGSSKYFEIPPLASQFILGGIVGRAGNFSQDELASLEELISNLEYNCVIDHEGSIGFPPTIQISSESTVLVEDIAKKDIGTLCDPAYVNSLTLKRQNLPLNVPLHVYVSYSESAVKFWIQAVSEEPNLLALDEELQEYAESQSPLLTERIFEGAQCLAKYDETETYYRSVIVSIDENDQSVKVSFVDYGNSSVVKFEDLLELPEKFCKLPAQSVECTLSGSAVNSVSFDQLIESENVYATITQVQNSGLHIVCLSNEARKESGTKDIQQQSAQPQRQVDLQTYRQIKLLENSRLDVCISSIESDGSFYCQLLKHAGFIDELMCEIKNAELVPMRGPIKEGIVCLARSSEDGILYRAQVVAGTVDGPQVRMVDFGDLETVTKSNLFSIPQQLITLPSQAIHCKLYDADSMSVKFIEQTLQQFNSSRALICKVKSSSSKSYEVSLFTMKPTHNINLNAEIEDENGNTNIKGTIPVPKLPFGTPLKLVGSSVIKGDLFFGQFHSYPPEQLRDIGLDLTAFYASNEGYRTLDWAVGDVCATKYKNTYLRGKIYKITGDVIRLILLDYGNAEKRTADELRILPAKFCRIPLAGVLCSCKKYYSEIDLSLLKELMYSKTFVVIPEELQQQIYQVSFPDVEENLELLANLEEFSVSHRSISKMPERIPSMEASNNKCITKPMIPDEHWEEMAVAYVDDPSKFFMQACFSEPELEELMADIDLYCRSLKLNESSVSNIKLGQSVLAMYDVDKKWYRGIVTGVMASSGSYEVHFVDYGNTDYVSKSAIRSIPSKFLTLPAQAIQCCLNGIDATSDLVWEEHQIDQFYNALVDVNLKTLICCKVSTDESYLVEIFREGINVNEKILSKFHRLSKRRKDPGPENKLLNRRSSPFSATAPYMNTRENGYPEKVSSKSYSVGIGASDKLKSKNLQTDFERIEFKEMRIEIDKYEDWNVSYAKTPECFWCQKVSNEDALQKLQEKLLAEYDNSPDVIPKPKIGMNCCALWSDDLNWYRATIVDVRNGKAVVYFVDYGNTEEVDFNSLKVLKKHYFELPMQAFECRLFGVEPLAEEWDEEASEFFQEKAMCDQLVGLACQKNKDGVYVVELVESNTPIHEMLIKKKLAKRSILKVSESDATNLSPKAENSNSSISKLDLQPGKTYTMYVVHINSPSDFFCQLKSESNKLQSVMDQLADTYSSSQGTELSIKNPQVGMLCCAKYSVDDGWYRGQIVGVKGNNVEVMYIDYGNVELTSIENVRQLLDSFTSLPMQAINVALNDVVPARREREWDLAAKTALEDITVDEVVQFTIQETLDVAYSGILTVKNISVSEKLVADGLADMYIKGEGFSKGEGRLESVPSVPKYTDYAKERLPVGKTLTISISWAVSPNEFYCQLFDSEQKIMNMGNALKAFYNGLPDSEMAISTVQTGTPCVAYYEEDDCWYRGTILRSREKEVLVRYVDYGNKEKVLIRKVKAIREDLLSIPKLAFQCHLKGMENIDVSQFTDEAISVLGKYVDKPMQLIVDGYEGELHIVDLFDDCGNSVCEMIIQAKKKQGSKGDPSNKFAPRTSVEKKSGAGFCDRGDHLKYPEPTVPLNPEDGYISVVINPKKFYVQLAKKEDELFSFVERVFEVYSTLTDGELAIENLVPNQVCCALYKEDQAWYRALVTGVRRSSANLCFIDYGNEEEVDFCDIRLLSEEFVDIPPFAFECSMKNLANNKCTDDDTSKLMELAAGGEKKFTIQFHTKTSPYQVVITDGSSNITELFAERPSSIMALTASSQYPRHTVPSGLTNAFISVAVNPCKFFVTLADEADDLAVLADQIHNEYSSLSEGERMIGNLVENQPCCALYQEDLVWYRGLVRKVDGDSVSVLFVDYGNEEVISLSDIRLLTEEYISRAPYSLECSLKGLSTFTPEDSDVFASLTIDEEKIFQVEFHDNQHPYEVSIYDGSKNINTHFAKKEVKKSYKKQQTPSNGIGYVSHVVNTESFFIQLASEEDALNKITEDVNEVATSASSISTFQQGMPCLAQFSEDLSWYRALILSGSGPVKVHFIDHGNDDDVAKDAIKEMPTKLLDIPPLAYACRLSLHGHKTGITEVEEMFLELTFEKALTVEFLNAAEPFEVILKVEGSVETLNAELSSLIEASSKVAADLPSSVTNEVKDYPKFDLSSISEKTKVFVSHIVSPSNFYIQLVKMESTLNEILDALDEKYSAATDDMRMKELVVGNACCAKYSADGVWYRAKITGVVKGDASVLFVDYGNEDTPGNDQIYRLDPECAPLAIQCRLKGLKEPENGWSEEIVSKFSELTEEKVLTADCKMCDSVCEVDLFDEDLSVAEQLQSLILSVQAEKTSDIVVSKEVEKESDESSETSKQVAQVSEVDTDLCVPQQNVANEEEAEVFCTYVVNPNDFWIQKASDETHLETLLNNLFELYEENDTLLKDIQIGQFCVAKSEDGNWYRSKILSLEDDEAQVLFVDYGNTEMISKDLLKPLGEKLLQPSYAVHCSLDAVKSSGQSWSEEDNAFFSGKVTEKELLVKFVDVSTSPVLVKLLDMGICVASQLKDAGFAESTSQEEVQCGQVSKSIPETESIEAVLKTEETQDLCIPPQDISCEEEIEAYCIHIENANDFWIQKASDDSALETLLSNLFKTYEQSDKQLVEAQIGMFCVAKSSDGNWYRSKIVDNEGDMALVLFIDYGNSEMISKDLLKPLGEELLQPSYAVHCSLDAVKSSEQDWSEEANEFFSEKVTDKKLLVKFVDVSTSPVLVKLLDMGICVASQLKEAGFAESTSEECVETELKTVEIKDLNISPQETTREEQVQNDKVYESVPDTEPVETELKTVESKYLCIPSQKVACDKQIEAFCTHAVNPNDFWIQNANDETRLETLLNNLFETYEDMEKEMTDFQVGQFCVAKSEDGNWYRSKILSLEDGGAQVLFVDYGNTEMISKDLLKPLVEELLQPSYAVHCSLDAVKSSGQRWSEEAKAFFSEKVTEKKLLVKFVDVSTSLVLVNLLDMGICVASQLKDAGFVEFGSKEEVQSELVTEPTKAETESLETELKTEESNTEESNELNIPPQIACEEKVQNEAMSEAIPETEQTELNKTVESKDLSITPQNVACDKQIEVFCTYAVNPNDFWIQNASDETHLETLLNNLFETYEDMEKEMTDIQVGQFCVAKSEDGNWYRSKILSLEDGGAQVLFVDYGNTEMISKDLLKPLVEELLQPSYAVHCSLDGVKSSEQSWSEEANAFFSEKVTEKKLLVKFVNVSTSPVLVKLLDMGICVASQLKDAGFAESTSQEVQSDKVSESIPETEPIEAVSAEQTKDLSIPPQEISNEEQIEVYCTHIENPNDFWIQKASDETALETLLSNLFDLYEESDAQLTDIQIGQFCVVKSEDGNWYRSKIISNEGDMALVLFVDYGNTEMVQFDLLRPLGEDMLLPSYAVHCSMDGIKPSGECWSEESNAYFSDLLVEKTIVVKFIDVETSPVMVKLFDRETDLSSLLLNVGFAESQEISTEDNNVEASESKPESSTETKAHEPSKTCDKRYKLPTLLPGDRVQVYVSNIVSPNNFSCQLVTSSEQLPLFTDRLQDFYSTATTENLSLDDLDKGTACVAKLQADDFWYRAQVMQKKSECLAEVYFVDYGNIEEVAIDQLKNVTEEFIEFPTQAFLCSLGKIKPVSGTSWDADACSRLEELCCASENENDAKKFFAEIIAIEINEDDILQIKLSLFDETSNIEDQLVSGGYAQNVAATSDFQPMIQLEGFHYNEDEAYEKTILSMAEDIVGEVVENSKCQIFDHDIEHLKKDPVSEDDNSSSCNAYEDGNSLLDVEYLQGESPAEFTVQLSGSAATELKNIVEKIKEQFETDVKKARNLAVGDVVLAMNTSDRCWYRANVVSVKDNIVEVKYIDLGTSEFLSASHVQTLDSPQRKEVLRLPSRLMKCRLEGIQTEEWTKEAQNFFVGIVSNQTLSLEIVSQDEDDIFSVYLHNLDRDSGSVNLQLVKEGFATVVAGSQLDIDLDVEMENQDELENSFMEESLCRVNSIGELAAKYQLVGILGSHSYSTVEINLGRQIPMRLLEVQDPDNIYMASEEDSWKWQDLDKDMQKFYKGSSACELSEPQIGQACAVKWKNKWHRAQISSVLDDVVSVFLVDLGQMIDVTIAEGRLLDQKFFATPMQAVACSIAMDRSGIENWPEDICEMIKELLGSNSVVVRVVAKEESHRHLVCVQTSDGEDLGKMVREYCLVLNESCNEGQNEPENNEASIDENESLSEEVKVQEYQYGTRIQSQILSIGYEGPATMSCVETPLKFWCRVNTEKFTEMSNQMTDFYQDLTAHRVTQDLQEGAVCAAQIADNGPWHRAQVTSSFDEVYTIFCVDSGTTETTTVNNLRLLEESFASEPAFAILCQFPDVKPARTTGDWESEVTDFLSGFVNVPLTMSVCGVRNNWHDVTLLSSETNLDIRQLLIENNFMRSADSHSSSQERMIDGEPVLTGIGASDASATNECIVGNSNDDASHKSSNCDESKEKDAEEVSSDDSIRTADSSPAADDCVQQDGEESFRDSDSTVTFEITKDALLNLSDDSVADQCPEGGEQDETGVSIDIDVTSETDEREESKSLDDGDASRMEKPSESS